MSSPIRVCLLVPTYDNPRTIRRVVETGRRYFDDVLVVDDGSAEEGRLACAGLVDDGLARVERRPVNGGKGAAVKRGFELARSLGYTHVLQVDADGQHDLSAAPSFLDRARSQPGALVLGYPEYDASAPRVRRLARRLTDFWVRLEVGRGVVRDAMVGFRVYPLEPLRRLRVRGDRMDFDIEVAVRLAWAGVPVANLPVGVRYLDSGEGGVSHFQPLRDSWRFARLHTRLCIERWFGAPGRFLLGTGRT